MFLISSIIHFRRIGDLDVYSTTWQIVKIFDRVLRIFYIGRKQFDSILYLNTMYVFNMYKRRLLHSQINYSYTQTYYPLTARNYITRLKMDIKLYRQFIICYLKRFYSTLGWKNTIFMCFELKIKYIGLCLWHEDLNWNLRGLRNCRRQQLYIIQIHFTIHKCTRYQLICTFYTEYSTTYFNRIIFIVPYSFFQVYFCNSAVTPFWFSTRL